MVEATPWQAVNCPNPADVTWRKSAAEGRQHRICWSQGQHNAVRNTETGRKPVNNTAPATARCTWKLAFYKEITPAAWGEARKPAS